MDITPLNHINYLRTQINSKPFGFGFTLLPSFTFRSPKRGRKKTLICLAFSSVPKSPNRCHQLTSFSPFPSPQIPSPLLTIRTRIQETQRQQHHHQQQQQGGGGGGGGGGGEKGRIFPTMPDQTPSCFLGVPTSTPPASTTVGPTLTTSVYETYLGVAALTWSRTLLGLSLRVELRLPCSSNTSVCSASTSSVSSSAVSSESNFDSFYFRFRPWILWKKRGTKRFHLKEQRRKVNFAWDLSRAAFPKSGGPEPSSGFFVAVAVDGEMFAIVGDFPEGEAYKKAKTKNPNFSISGIPSFSRRKGSPANPILISRSEHVVLSDSGGNSKPYTTRAKMGGKQREISIDLGSCREKDAKLQVGVDGKRLLQVKRLRWKFRGNECVDAEDGRILVSWDVHNWLFSSPSSTSTPPPSSETPGHAVLVFRFDRNEIEERDHFAKTGGAWGTARLGHFGNSERSISSGSTGFGGGMRGRKKKSLLKTSSSSSSASTASTTSNSSVIGWASAEENELKESDGFYLVVYVWKR